MNGTTPAPAEALLVDPRLGVVTSLAPYAAGVHAPATWAGWSARVADTTAFATWSADRHGFGASLDDPDRARRAALGEAVERYCGNAVPARLEIASWTQLRQQGRAALDPRGLALHSAEQHATPGFPFVPFTVDLPVAWVEGTDLHTGEPALVPASLAYLNYFAGPHADEPPTHALVYSGIATGPSVEDAVTSAVEELAERDALTLWWDAGLTARALTGTDELLGELGLDALLEPAGDLRVRLLQVPSDLGLPVVAALVEHQAAGLVAFGSACRARPREAVAKALTEALAMLELTREVAEEGSPLWQAVARGDFAEHTFRPFRADRRYAACFRPDLRDVVDLPTLAQFYLDPAHQGVPLDRLRAHEPSVRLADVPLADPADHLARIAGAQLPAYLVDLTTADVAASGLHVVRVVVPGLYGNAPPAFPLLGGDRRAAAVAVAVAREPVPTLDRDGLYSFPLPQI